MLGSNSDGVNVIEENTHIAYLCDLLERIWGHGLKKRDSKSPLWAHLMAYAENVAGPEEFSLAGKGRVSPSGPAFLTSSMTSLAIHSTSAGMRYTLFYKHVIMYNVSLIAASCQGDESPRLALRAHFKRRKFQSPQLRSRVECVLQPRPPTLLENLS